MLSESSGDMRSAALNNESLKSVIPPTTHLQSEPPSLERWLRVGYMSGNDATFGFQPLPTAIPDVSILVGAIIHEIWIVRIAMNIRLVVIPR